MTKGVVRLQRTLKSTLAVITKEEFSDCLSPQISFNSCKEAIVEGSKGVLEYKSDTVRINCGKYILKFKGDNLCIRAPDAQEVVLSGEIVSMEFLSC